MEISSPPIFDFQPIKSHLNRSPKELLHQVEGEKVWKWIKNESNEGLISFTHREGAFHINIEQEKGKGFQASLPEYFEAWFDLKRDLAAFYKQVEEDGLLAPLTRELYGLRVVGVPDLFEALSWAILGQQVNLSFAYSMKARLIEKYGSYLEYEGRKFWAFPNPKTISKAHIDTLKSLSISQRKAEYLIEVAQQLVRGSFSKSSLLDLGKADLIEKELCKIRGIGPWTAHYVMLRCLRIPQAYPVGDAGLQNAVKQRLQMDRKPSYDELYSLAENWKGWEAYATFYLWNGLNKT